MATSILNNYQPPARPSDTLTPAIFHGDKLHPEERDRMSLTRISNQVALSLSEIISGEQKELQSYQILSAPAATMEQCKAIAAWAAKAGEPLYLLFGSRGGNVVAHSMQVNDMEKFVIDMELYINSNIPFMLARKNPADFGNLTAMDILSTEAMSRESISAFIDRLIDPKNISGKNRDIYDPRGRGNSMNKKQIMEGKLRLINVTYHSAVLFIQLFGIQLRESQINRKFESIEDFKEHIYRIKPELNELGKKDERYVFERKNGVGMIIECALIRAMDHTYDTLSSDRFWLLDQESVEILKKIKSIRGVVVSNENESGFDIRYNHPDRYFEGHVYLRKKNFFKILLKMAYNRRYGEAEALKDLLGMRYETLNPNQENMANAVAFFQHEIFDKGAVYEQKGGLLDVSIIRDKDIQFNPIDPRKRGTNSKLKNGDITGTVSRKEPGLEVFTTGNVEMQFQNIGGMENGYNKTEIYELKKFLSAASRILKGFDIKNLKFFIQVFTSEVTGLSEQNILNHLFFPTEGWDQSMSPNDEHDGDEPSQENPAELWISKFWDSSHGFILPLKSKKGGVRFTTRDIISPSYFDLYNKSYLQPASISFDYLLKMYNRANVQKEVDTFKKLRIEMETNIHLKEI